MKRSLSISLRLSLWFCAVFLVGFLIFGLAMWFDLAYSLAGGRDRTVAGRAKRLEALLQGAAADPGERRSAKFDDFAQATPEGNYIQVFDTRGKLLYPRNESQRISFPWPRHTSGGNPQFDEVEYDRRPYRVYSKEIVAGGEGYRLFVAGNLQDNRTLLRRFSLGLTWAIPASLAVSALLGYYLNRRALHPIARLTASARSITIGNLSRRLPISRTGDELEQLAETCNDMLARLELAVGQITRFTSDASHELRSPISIIRTTAEFALSHPEIDRESAESFREILAESEQASKLLEDLLTLARSDAGHAETAFEAVDLVGIVNDVSSKILPFAHAHGHVLTVNISGARQAMITGDVASLRRLIWILIDNAIKYTPEGGIIQVRLDSSGSQACLSVRDSGVGIPAASIPRIFERFYRIDSSRSQEGTGLGLAIAKWIADTHRAQISVESAQNAGTTFSVTFRLA